MRTREDDEHFADTSLPVRGAWIEIIFEGIKLPDELVAPRAGSVD